ncbi:MAG: GAF domain-containing protein, partial [Chloroflexota bacterium]
MDIERSPARYLLNVTRQPREVGTPATSNHNSHALLDAARSFAVAPIEWGDLHQRIADHVAAGVGDVCVVRTPTADGKNLQIAAIGGTSREQIRSMPGVFPERNPIDEGVVGQVYSTGTVVRYQLEAYDDAAPDSPLAKDSIENMRSLGIHSILIAPIQTDERVIGTIGIMRNRTRRAFSDTEETFVRYLAQLAALSMESRELQDELHETVKVQQLFARQMQEIAETSVEITKQRDLDSALDLVTRRSREIIGAHMSVTSFTVDQDWAQVVATTDFSDEYSEWRDYDEKPSGAGIYRIVCSENRPYRMTQAELEAHPAWRAFGEYAGQHPPLRGWLAAPLMSTDGTNLGLIQLSDRYEGDFTETDEAVLVQLAHAASTAIDNARLNDDIRESLSRVEEQARRLAILAEITRVLVSAPLDPDTIARRAATQIGQQVGDTCVIRLLTDDGEFLEPVGIYHPDDDAKSRMRSMLTSRDHHVGDGLAGTAVQTGKTTLIEEIDPKCARSNLGDKYADYLEFSEIHSSLVTPLYARGRIIGSLGLSRISPGRSYTAE